MAFTRLSLPFSLLLMSTLIVIAFAADYGYNGIPADSPQAKPEYDSSKPNGEEKPNYGDKPTTYKPNSEEKPVITINLKPKEEEKEKPGYENKPYNVVKFKPEGDQVKSGYDTTKPDFYSIAIEGFVYCKTPSSHYPIPKALAKVICEAVDEVGVEKTAPICSVQTDAKGYFYAIVSSINESLKLKDCKAFLESSPETNCNVPTDMNKGITGFPISGDAYRVLNDKHTKLYSAQPFFYTSETNPAPNGY
ncbi:hypothetical protein PTKIN_Ptkin14bG0218400 [Pterospermum kingtungense]